MELKSNPIIKAITELEEKGFVINSFKAKVAVGNKASFLVWIKPETFLDLTTNDEKMKNEIKKRALEKANEILTTKYIIWPFLVIDWNEMTPELRFKVQGHEGRHRMAIYGFQEIPLVPVFIYTRERISKKELAEIQFPITLLGQYSNVRHRIKKNDVIDMISMEEAYEM